LNHYLSFGYIPLHRTLFNGIYKLPPAHFLLASLNGRPSITRYWDIASINKLNVFEEKILVHKIYKKIIHNVKIRLKDSKNVGILLSGGLDSGTIAAFLKNIIGDTVNAFSITYENPWLNELKNIKKIVEYLGINHHIKEIKPDDINEKFIRKIVRLYGEPCAISSVIPSYFASKLSSRYVPIVFTGDGGDEAFLGYSSLFWKEPSLFWKEPRILKYYSKLSILKEISTQLMIPILERLVNVSDDRRFAIALDFFERKSMSDPDPQVRFGAKVLARFFSPEDIFKLGISSEDHLIHLLVSLELVSSIA